MLNNLNVRSVVRQPETIDQKQGQEGNAFDQGFGHIQQLKSNDELS